MPERNRRTRSVRIQDLVKVSKSISGSDDGVSPNVMSHSGNSISTSLQSAPGRYGTDYFKFPETIDEEVVSNAIEATERYLSIEMK